MKHRIFLAIIALLILMPILHFGEETIQATIDVICNNCFTVLFFIIIAMAIFVIACCYFAEEKDDEQGPSDPREER